MADLDVDGLDNVDYDDSDVWSVTDFSNYSSDVDMEDYCVFNMISVVDQEMIDAHAYCRLLARQIYRFYESGPLVISG